MKECVSTSVTFPCACHPSPAPSKLWNIKKTRESGQISSLLDNSSVLLEISKEILPGDKLWAVKQGKLVLVEVVTLRQKPLQHGGDFQQQKEETGENPALNRTDGAAVSPSNIHHKPGTKVER